jgi:hypothetical protein
MASCEVTVVVTTVENPMRTFADAGWEFHYDEATRFVGASHALGGAFSICEVAQFIRSGGEKPITFHEVGHAIAAWMNERSHAEQPK